MSQLNKYVMIKTAYKYTIRKGQVKYESDKNEIAKQLAKISEQLDITMIEEKFQ